MSDTNLRPMLKTIEVLVDLLIGELDSYAPVAFAGVKRDKDRLVRALQGIPDTFAEWWERDPP